jgi:membrane fusion protein
MIPETTLAEAEQETLDKSAALERLRQQAVILEREAEQAASELRAIPLRRDTAFVEIDKRILEIDQELAETKARRGVVINAPMSGVVSSLQAETGSAAPQNIPLLTIVPEDSKLVAHLYGPSRSVGLVKKNDHANLRYEAFPYQRFGIYSATVKAVSKSALGPAELPPQLSAISGRNAPGEPLYRVVLELDEQVIRDGRNEITLQSGLQVEADIALESRPVYRWLLDPIFNALEPAGR